MSPGWQKPQDVIEGVTVTEGDIVKVTMGKHFQGRWQRTGTQKASGFVGRPEGKNCFIF